MKRRTFLGTAVAATTASLFATIVETKDGYLILVTDRVENNVIVYDSKGKL